MASTLARLAYTLSLFAALVHSFVPASPYSSPDGTAPNFGGIETALRVTWKPQHFTATDAHLIVQGPQGLKGGTDHGALVRFADSDAAAATTGSKTPWVALVNCDPGANTSDASIVQRAADLGAVALLLYSQQAETCEVTQFSGDIDIYVLPSTEARDYVLNTYKHIDWSRYRDFNATTLDSAFDAVTSRNDAVAVPFLVADFIPSGSAPNATASASGSHRTTSSTSVAQTGTASSTGSAPKETSTHSGALSNSPVVLMLSGILSLSVYMLVA
ncbi:hypothetical protein OH77DRAFT_950334 [Trametes cingulata]|nr:hypothetical protein OH77DRAFT_950334 [Trametes cingulata]